MSGKKKDQTPSPVLHLRRGEDRPRLVRHGTTNTTKTEALGPQKDPLDATGGQSSKVLPRRTGGGEGFERLYRPGGGKKEQGKVRQRKKTISKRGTRVPHGKSQLEGWAVNGLLAGSWLWRINKFFRKEKPSHGARGINLKRGRVRKSR